MSQRKARLADQIKDTVAACLCGGQMNDPRLQLVTVTACKISPDLQVASIYFRVLETQPAVEAKAGLDSAAGFFRRRLAEELDVRRVPILRFFLDESIERGARVEQLLDQWVKEDDPSKKS